MTALRLDEARLVEDGFEVVERFIDADTLRRLEREVDAAVQAPSVQGCERPFNRLVPLRWDSAVVDAVLRDRHGSIAEIVGGTDLRWISGYVSVKEPHTPALWWHQDWWCWDHPVSFRAEAPQVAMLIYLSDTGERRGALRVLPGSHRASVPFHARLPEAHTHETNIALLHPAMCDHPDQTTLNLNAGDAVVLDYRLLHGTHSNKSSRRRDAILLSFAPSWRDLPSDIKGHLIQHPALPSADDDAGSVPWAAELLPCFEGPLTNLPLNRVPPGEFAIETESIRRSKRP
jgi:hypothetical protein